MKHPITSLILNLPLKIIAVIPLKVDQEVLNLEYSLQRWTGYKNRLVVVWFGSTLFQKKR